MKIIIAIRNIIEVFHSVDENNIINKKLIIFFSIAFFMLLIIYNENNFKINNMKVCICTIGKKENRYIKEFVEYYKKFGIDKIFLYDNNDLNDEKFEEIIDHYVKKKFVQIYNFRGKKKKLMIKLWQDCYLRNFKKFDWLAFFDIDEYIYLKNYKSIKPFLNEKKFENCSKIYLNWIIHTDNNLLYYDNRTLHERFPILEPNARKNNRNCNANIKTILRGHIPNLKFKVMHIFNRDIKGCDAYGKVPIINNYDHMKYPDFLNYYSKSVEEFIEKLNKGDVYFGNKTSFKIHRIKRYFKINDITFEKINYIEKKTGLNLTKFRNMLKKTKKNYSQI